MSFYFYYLNSSYSYLIYANAYYNYEFLTANSPDPYVSKAKFAPHVAIASYTSKSANSLSNYNDVTYYCKF